MISKYILFTYAFQYDHICKREIICFKLTLFSQNIVFIRNYYLSELNEASLSLSQWFVSLLGENAFVPQKWNTL